MKKTCLYLVFLMMCLPLSAQVHNEPFDVKLWENGLPNTNGKDHLPEDRSKGIFTPELRVYLPNADKATGRAVVACPGGGYGGLALGHEGNDWAPYFNDMGIAYIVLKYRMPNGNHEVPVSDATEAMRVVHEKADEWNINPNDIGIMGSSAGGHLASTIATTAPFDIRPDFQILFYPVISMSPRNTHMGSLNSLLGRNASEEMQRRFSNERNVKRHVTPPAIMLLSDDDRVVPSSNSVNYYTALRNNDISATMHIYPSGDHGWGCKPSFRHHSQMMADLTAWLEQLEAPRKDAVRVACVGNSITDGMGIAYSNVFGYPAVLNRLLGKGYSVKNFGLSAHTMLNKGDIPYMNNPVYAMSKAFNPDIVIIKLGTNDTKAHNWKYKEEFAKDMQQMIDEYKALPSKPAIYLAHPAKCVKPSFGLSDSIIVNEIIPIVDRLAKKNKLETIDLHSLFDKHPEYMQRDGIHPNERGAAAMAEIVKSHIVK